MAKLHDASGERPSSHHGDGGRGEAHSHACTHDHAHGPGGHGHHHGPANYNRAFALGLALNIAFVMVEVGYGLAADSLALLADAGHNFSDVIGLVLAWGAAWLSGRGASDRRTYGFGRTTILASLVNAVILLVAIGGIAWEAIARFGHPEPVEGVTVMWVAAFGIVINAVTALMFFSGSKGDLNIRGAFLHMAADAGVSLGVVLAALLMGFTGWLWLDPAISLVIVAVIAIGTWGLFRESLDLSLDAVPGHIDRQAVERYLAALPGVDAVHDLHIWPLSTTSVALTAHLVKPDAVIDDGALNEIAAVLKGRFGIDHATIQMERGDGQPCALSHAHQG